MLYDITNVTLECKQEQFSGIDRCKDGHSADTQCFKSAFM